MEHALFVYDDDPELAASVGPLLRHGLERDSATIMVVDNRKCELLRDVLGTDGARVQFIDCDTHYTRPEAALADYDARLRRLRSDGAESVCLFGELPRLRGSAGYARWVAYEAILNRALAHHPVSIVCGYDTRVVPDAVVEEMRRTHPRLLGDPDAVDENPAYVEPAEVVRSLTPAPEPVGELDPLALERDAFTLRARLRERMQEASVPHADVEEMLLAIDEILANAERHGGGVRQLRAGRVGERFVLEVSDRGGGLQDPLAGYLPPKPGAVEGVGLWVARQVTRRLDVIPGADGLTVRLSI
jgi:anti-sigma regulatory factor (Ser/Thr protein kinase)